MTVGSTVRSNVWMRKRVWGRAFALLGTVALVGCEGTVTLDMATMTAADPQISGVFVELDGVELQGSSGTETIRFDDPVEIDLLDFVDGNVFRLFTDEELPDGRYTGARLLFDQDDEEDDAVTLFDGDVLEINTVEGAVADVAFTVDKDDSSREDIVLTLDVRQSLSFNDNTNVYTLTPVVRGVRTEDSGDIFGNVTRDCPNASPLAEGGAVYLFAGRDRTPDDRDGRDEEPYLTTRVEIQGGVTALPQYIFDFIPDGDYTIAFTCHGDEDDAATDDNLNFEDIANIEVRAEEQTTHDFE